MGDNTVPPAGGRIHEHKIDAVMAPMTGDLQRSTEVAFNAAMVPMTATLQRSTLRQLWEKSWPWLIPYLLITFLSPLIGLFLTGWPGVAVGEVLGIANLIIGLYAVTRIIIKETNRL